MKLIGKIIWGIFVFFFVLGLVQMAVVGAKNYVVAHWPWFALAGLILLTIIVILSINAVLQIRADKRSNTADRESTADRAARLAREARERERKKEQQKEEQQYERQEQTSEQKSPPRTNWSIGSRADALEVLDLQEPFTQDELKKRWRSLLKQTHPDQGGSNMVLRLVNEAYEYLKATN